MLASEHRMVWEKRDEALQRESLDRLWKAATTPWPRTCVGQWLRALLLNQQALRDRLKLTLNGGKPGWNHDEHFVVGSVCEIAVRKLFPAGLDIREVAAFVTDMRSRIHSTTPPDQHVCEAMIRDAFRDQSVDFTDISVGEIFHAQCAITVTAIRNLGLDDAAIDEMIVEGERLAFYAGRHPPLDRPGPEAGVQLASKYLPPLPEPTKPGFALAGNVGGLPVRRDVMSDPARPRMRGDDGE